jgi:hypothetical protein
MKSIFATLLKNIVLLILLIVCIVFVFTPFIGYKEIWYIFFVIAPLFILTSLYEAMATSKLNDTTRKFMYTPDSYITKLFIKTVLLTGIGYLLFFSGKSTIKFLSFVCFLIVITDLLVALLRKIKNLCFVAFENDYFISSTSKIEAIKASAIQKIETRHGLTYFVSYSKKTLMVRSDVMKENSEFQLALNNWIKKNNIQEKRVGE